MKFNSAHDPNELVDRPRLGLALGGGGARGYAHFGVIKALQDNDIPIDVIAGTSMGAVVGGLYVCDQELDRVIQLLKSMDLHKVFGIPQNPVWRVVGRTMAEYLYKKGTWRQAPDESTLRILEFYRLLTYDRSFEDLKTPFAAVATDVDSGQEVVMDRGKICHALTASVSLASIREPVEWRGRFLIDGGYIDRLPVRVAVALGADVVLAGDVVGNLPLLPNTALEIMAQAGFITSHELYRTQLELMHSRLGEKLVVVRPEVASIHTLQLDAIEQAVALGYQATEAALPDIWRALTTASSERATTR